MIVAAGILGSLGIFGDGIILVWVYVLSFHFNISKLG